MFLLSYHLVDISIVTKGDKSSIEKEGRRGGTTKSGNIRRRRKRLRNEPQNVVGEEREAEKGRKRESGRK